MVLFLTATALLILGYVIYGSFVERIFGADKKRVTPAIKCADGVDFVVLPSIKIFLIQFLNIAGLGPVFGALLGAIYGPSALLWIVFGSIFAGATHDYISAMMSMRNEGRSAIFFVKEYLGAKFKAVFMVFLILFLFVVGAVFAMAPARMLASISNWPFGVWISVIFIYYFLATLLPIDKIIGRIYPIFALLLIGVTGTLLYCLLTSGWVFYPDLTLTSQNPNGTGIFPIMFITIACGAISGFHATQSPMMAKCLKNEKMGRPIFYGAMITEGFVALIWCTLGIAFYQTSGSLADVIAEGGPGGAVTEISSYFLGTIGGVFTVLSVVVLSITTGDTAFRSARLTLAEYLRIPQKDFNKRLMISAVVLSGGVALSFFNLTQIWVYFGWGNQVLAAITLWICSMYLKEKKKFYWITLIPASFMTVVCATYLFMFVCPIEWATGISIALTAIASVLFFRSKK